MQSNRLSFLQDQVEFLSNLQTRLQTLRHIPSTLLRVPITPANAASTAARMLMPEFQEITELSDAIRSKRAQEALRCAQESFQVDTSDLNPDLRRENRKRKRPSSPDSAQPYVAAEGVEKSTLLFPFTESGAEPLQIGNLSVYIQEFNRSHTSKLHLWRRARGTTQTEQTPAIVRFTIPDVLTAYLTLVVSETGVVLTESLAVFSPRERKPSHTQSDFVVYRNLSQQLARMLHSEPLVSFQKIVDLMCAYEGLFVERCTICGRVLSSEGHVPPVVRVWTEGRGWMARHIGCRI